MINNCGITDVLKLGMRITELTIDN